MLQRDLPAKLIDTALDELADENLQCDARFAESYTRMRVGRGYGANKVRADLQLRQVDTSVIDRAVRSPEVDWQLAAVAALEKKFSVPNTTEQKADSKMQRYLYQRGFGMTEIRSAIKEFEQIKA